METLRERLNIDYLAAVIMHGQVRMLRAHFHQPVHMPLSWRNVERMVRDILLSEAPFFKQAAGIGSKRDDLAGKSFQGDRTADDDSEYLHRLEVKSETDVKAA